MKFLMEDSNIWVYVLYKNNKNMYLRIKEDGVYITVPKRMKMKKIYAFLEENREKILQVYGNMLKKKQAKDGKLLYLGKMYDICFIKENRILFGNEQVFLGRDFLVSEWFFEQAKRLFLERLDFCYHLFEEEIPYPKLKLRWMKSKWGVCNIKKQTITMNTDLIHYDLKYLDYVLIHELCHFLEANHSKNFWNIVSKYVPDYKQYRKDMKEFVL